VYVLWRLQLRVPTYIQGTILIALLLHYVGGSLGSPSPYHMGYLGTHGINGAYHTYEWWDHLTHGVGIGASAMGIAYLLEVYQTRRRLGWSASGVWIAAVLAAVAAGVAVELYEFLGKTAFQTIDQGGYENTVRDLHFNLMGAMAGAGLAVTINRAKFHALIRRQWNIEMGTVADGRWWRHLPPAMAGFLVFVSIPALTALYLSTQFFSRPLPTDDLAHYDTTLYTLLGSAAAAVVAGPLAALGYRQFRRRVSQSEAT
jgi:hypothetical protein